MADLRNQQLKDRYQTLLTLSDTGTDPATGTLQNGRGTPITGLTLNSLGLNTTQGISRLQVNNIGSDTSFFDVVGGDAIIAGNSVTVSKTQRGILHIENNQIQSVGRNASLTFGLGGSQFINTYYHISGAIRTETTGSGNTNINPKMVFSVLNGSSTTGTLVDRLEISHTGAVTVGGTLSAGKLVPTANTVAGNGMYLPAENIIGFSTDGAERLRITNNTVRLIGNNGNPSIISDAGLFADTLPRLSLETDVTGNYNTLFVIRGTAGSSVADRRVGMLFKLSSESSNNESNKMGAIYLESTNSFANFASLILATANVPRLTITSTGNVDIGGTVTAGKFSPTSDTVTGNGMYLPAANTLALSTNGVERVRVDSSGNVGIGTSSTDDYVLNLQRPGATNNSFTILNIQSSWVNSATDKGATRLQFQAKDADVNASAPTTIATIDALTPNNWTSEADARGYLRFNTLNDGILTEAMRINSSQNVRIGSSGALVSGLLVSRATGTATPTPAEIRIQTTSDGGDWSASLPWGRLSFYSSDVSSGGAKIHAGIDVIAQNTTGALSDMVFFNCDTSANRTPVLRILRNSGGNANAVHPETDNAQQLGLSSNRWGTIHTGSITIGTGANNRATIAYTTNTARTYTIPDVGANADFIMSEGTQTINGPKTFGSVTRIPSGINFNASGGSTLSHYEVGTFNADVGTLTVNYTFTKKEGRYTRIGDTVTVYFDYRWTSTNTGTGDTEFTGLPFTAAKDATVNFILMNGVIDTVQVWGRVLEGTSKFNIRGRTRNESTIYGPAPKTIWNASGATNILSGYITYHI